MILGSRVGAPQVVDLVLESQQRLTIEVMNQLLGKRFVRIDRVPSGLPARSIPALDATHPSATLALKAFADSRVDQVCEERTVGGVLCEALMGGVSAGFVTSRRVRL